MTDDAKQTLNKDFGGSLKKTILKNNTLFYPQTVFTGSFEGTFTDLLQKLFFEKSCAKSMAEISPETK